MNTKNKNVAIKIVNILLIGILLMYLLVPLFATFLYSISKNWTTTVLPEDYSVKWFLELYKDINFYAAIFRTFLISAVGTIGSVILVVPTVFLLYINHPKKMWIMDFLQILSFSVPAVISAMSLMSAYSGSGIPMIIFVLGAYIIGGIPMIQLGTRNSLRAINAKEIMESSEILGASKFMSFLKVILPNIKNGVIASSLFRFSILFGEFGTLNLLMGGAFPNIQIFLRQNMERSGHYTAAISISYFTLVTIVTIIGLYLTNEAYDRR